MFDTVEVLHERIFAASEELRRELAALERPCRESVPALATVEARELLATYADAARLMPPMSAEEMVKRALLGHIDEHFGSIRKTIGG